MPPAWGDCDSPGRSSGDAGAAVPQVSAAERRGGVVGGAHRVGVLGSLAGATCGPRSNFSSVLGKLRGTREGVPREFGRGSPGMLYLVVLPDPGSPGRLSLRLPVG